MGEIMHNLLQRASDAYYLGNPIMSDAEFDILSAHFNYKTVGHTVTGGVPHFFRMYSLQNCFNLEDAPLNLKDCVETPKMDGAAISILYIGGKLSLALTRGDGKLGQDITDKIETLVPNKIGGGGLIQITGEVVAPKSIPNARNYAAGALNLKSIEEFVSRDLTFVAYGLEGIDSPSWSTALKNLHDYGIWTVLNFDATEYPTDGLVYRVDDMKKYKEMGYTSHHPRGAFALKEQKAGVVTTLEEVIWQVGKSGAVSPVGIFTPVDINGATVARATLHNIEYINELNLEIGCQIEVIRSGEVIPRIVRRV